MHVFTKQCSIITNNEYLIPATISQCCNTIDHFNFRQKTRLIMHCTMTRHSSRLIARLFHLKYGSNASNCINNTTEHQQMCTNYRRESKWITSKDFIFQVLGTSGRNKLQADGLANRCTRLSRINFVLMNALLINIFWCISLSWQCLMQHLYSSYCHMSFMQ